MKAVRAGAVGYLNARPLVRGLDDGSGSFDLRFDPPSRCAALLHDGAIDLGMIPSIEYLRGADYRVVPGVAIVSHGPVRSVALYSTRPIEAVTSIALDSSSRASVALLRVLCARWFRIEPVLTTVPPDLPGMVRQCDAALLIGDAALFADHEALGLTKTDLGDAWHAMTGLPFVYAFWAGRPGVLDGEHVTRLQRARDEGVAAIDDVAAEYYPADGARAAVGAVYLRENIRYNLNEPERAGLERFFELAGEIGLVPASGPVRFY